MIVVVEWKAETYSRDSYLTTLTHFWSCNVELVECKLLLLLLLLMLSTCAQSGELIYEWAASLVVVLVVVGGPTGAASKSEIGR